MVSQTVTWSLTILEGCAQKKRVGLLKDSTTTREVHP